MFGSKFAQMIKGNENLMREWATSSDQAMMMVQVTMEGLREMGRSAFDEFAQGMGQNIADAIVYQKSIGDAMRSALASTLESIAAQAITYAIYATALGFLRLAQHDPVGAASAFTSAAIWGAVGGVAAVAGRFIAPSQSSSTASSGSAAAASSGTAASSDSTAAGVQQQQVLNISFSGPVYGGQAGIDQLCAAISDAVNTRNTKLTATNTTTGQVVRR